MQKYQGPGRPRKDGSKPRVVVPILSKPACFDTEAAYMEWVAYAKLSRLGLNSPTAHCRDCTPMHKSKMRATGRCEHPEVIFDNDPEGGVFGCAPDELDAIHRGFQGSTAARLVAA